MKLALVLVLALFGNFCKASTTAIAPSPDVGAVAIESFAGRLAVGGSAFYSFTTPRDGTVSLTLLTLNDASGPTSASMLLSVGLPSGTGCTNESSASASVGATPQLSSAFTAGVYCAKITDTGNLSSTATFSLNIVHTR